MNGCLTRWILVAMWCLPLGLPPARAQELEDIEGESDVPSVEDLRTAEELDAGKGGEDPASAYDEMELLTEVMLLIKKHYVEEKSYEAITQGALQGMLSTLDPHSSFLDAEAYDGIQEDTSGRFSGIGIHVGMRDGLLTIIAPIEDTPGFRAGLQSGDRILKIDGKKAAGMQLREAVSCMRGGKGTAVVLTISRDDEEGPRDVEIVREDIEVPSVKGGNIIRDGIGYIRITQFAEPTAAALQEKLDVLATNGMDALVLDLRNNPGGLLKSAIEVAQKFLEKGALVVTTRGRATVLDEARVEGKGETHELNFPMAILVNQGSASASEIVAGALQDHGRAVLIGDTTFGKASVQSVIKLRADGKSAVRMTTAHYFTPSGREIHDQGIDPDIPVELTVEEWRRVQIRRAHVENPGVFPAEEVAKYTDVVDRQLERAVDLLQAVKIFREPR
jgi:carboxyl-terminal processing protease